MEYMMNPIIKNGIILKRTTLKETYLLQYVAWNTRPNISALNVPIIAPYNPQIGMQIIDNTIFITELNTKQIVSCLSCFAGIIYTVL